MAEYKGKLLKGLFTQAKNVLMSDGESVETTIRKNGIASFVSISSYTPSNMYEIPADGYITLNNRGSSYNALLLIIGYNGSQSYTVGIGGAQGQFSLFVKKGMKAYIYEGSTGGAYFLPLS